MCQTPPNIDVQAGFLPHTEIILGSIVTPKQYRTSDMSDCAVIIYVLHFEVLHAKIYINLNSSIQIINIY